MQSPFLVVTRIDIPTEREKEMDDFFREEYFTSLLSVAGVLSVRRCRLVQGEGPEHIVVWEVERPEVMEGEASKKAAFTPGGEKIASYYTTRSETVYEEIIGFRQARYEAMKSDYLLIAQMDIPPEMEDEFNDWYNKEHVPLLMMVPGWMAAKRFRRIQGDYPKYMTMYEIEGPWAREREEHERTHTTEWYQRIRPHFRNFSSVLYEQLYGLSRY